MIVPSEDRVGRISGEPFLRSMLGTLVLLLLIRWFEPLFFGPDYYAELSVHPFWIVVILAAAQGGLFVGVTTAGLASLLMDWPGRPLDVDITAHYAELAIVPVQWVLSAVLIGTFRQMQIAAEAALRSENARLIETNETIAEEVSRLDAALFQLELAAATRSRNAGTALLALAELGASDAATLGDRLADAAALLTLRPGCAILPVEGSLPQVLAWGGEPAQDLGASGTELAAHPTLPEPGAPARVLAPHRGAHAFAACRAVRSPGTSAHGCVAIFAEDAQGAEEELGVAAVLAQALESALATVAARTPRRADKETRQVPLRTVG